jgi:hypothetical protein
MIVVTPKTIFRLSTQSVPGEIQLSPEAWRVVAQINGARTLTEIADNLNTDSLAIARTAEGLYRLGLFEAGDQSEPPARATVNGVFFNNIEAEFVKMIGPFGQVLIEDELTKLGESRQNFPRDKVAALVEGVSNHITDEQRRLNFQRIMLEAIRKL